MYNPLDFLKLAQIFLNILQGFGRVHDTFHWFKNFIFSLGLLIPRLAGEAGL